MRPTMTVGQFILEYRKKNEYSQGDLGRLLKCNHQVISNLERGQTMVPWTFCKRFMKILGWKDREILNQIIAQESLKRVKKGLEKSG